MAKKEKQKGAPAKRKRSIGRRHSLTPELVERICQKVRQVHYNKQAIESLGYSERSLYNWLGRGEDELERMEARGLVRSKRGEEVFVQLVREVRQARADNQAAHATNIQRAGLGAEAEYLRDEKGKLLLDKDGQPHLLRPAQAPCWQASARYLEAVDPEKWGRKIRTELTTPEGGPTELRITVVKKREIPEDLRPKD
ncbi:MAG: hypothetical protein GY769_07940 [bacterium]|nr:hypothetical protein [bacterium]